jgi:hypothetical protein
MAALKVFFEKKELRLLGVRPWICVFLIFFSFNFFFQMDQIAMSVLTVLIF